jgi:hypothetical protein
MKKDSIDEDGIIDQDYTCDVLILLEKFNKNIVGFLFLSEQFS